MENLEALIVPKAGNKINQFDKHSKYIVKIHAAIKLENSLFEYAENFFKAAHMIAEFVLYKEIRDTWKRDSYFFAIAFLYRHCMELGLKAIGFQYIQDIEERTSFVKETRHNLFAILKVVNEKSEKLRTDEEIEWMKRYFDNLSQMDKDSDSFRYPFHIFWKSGIWNAEGVFNSQTHVNLVKFVNKFEAAYEIIKKWYSKDTSDAVEWKELDPIFIETGGYCYEKAIIEYANEKLDFLQYTKAYLETANYLKRYMKRKTDLGKNMDCKNCLFLPMGYLYRNCVELYLKEILFEELDGCFPDKCKFMADTKHSIAGMWKKIKPSILRCKRGNQKALEYLTVIEDYCMQVHELDSDANMFRYPMRNTMQVYFPQNKRFDFMQMGDFFEVLNNILADIDMDFAQLNDQREM